MDVSKGEVCNTSTTSAAGAAVCLALRHMMGVSEAGCDSLKQPCMVAAPPHHPPPPGGGILQRLARGALAEVKPVQYLACTYHVKFKLQCKLWQLPQGFGVAPPFPESLLHLDQSSRELAAFFSNAKRWLTIQFGHLTKVPREHAPKACRISKCDRSPQSWLVATAIQHQLSVSTDKQWM